MELIAEIVTACLDHLGEIGLHDWFPGDNEPESFVATCEIDHTDRSLPMEVQMCGYFMWLWERNGKLEVYTSAEVEHLLWRVA